MNRKKQAMQLEKNQIFLALGALLIFAVVFANFFEPIESDNSNNNSAPDKQLNFSADIDSKDSEKIKSAPEPVSVEKIYALFVCACCGNPLDKNNICCGSAEDRINYIDSLVETEVSETDVIIKMIQKYGMDSLSEEGKKLEEEIRIELAERAPKDRPIIQIEPDSFDFGKVSVKKGVVSTVVKILNDGEQDLVINNIDSSCMCTTASINFNGISGPVFGMSMHGNPENWSVSIPPKQEAELKIYYDPTVHSDLEGQHLVRIISIFSNDPIDFEKKVRVDIDQVQ